LTQKKGEKMVLNVKQSKNMPYTDEEINQYCESVEKLLMKIKEDSLTKKRRKVREIEVEEEHVTADEDEFALT
jgi:Na+/phosphate symporter